MKQKEIVIFKKSYKKSKKYRATKISLGMFLFVLLLFFLFSEKISFLQPLIRPVTVEKVFATQEIISWLSPTPTASTSPLFDPQSLLQPTPTPTPDFVRPTPQANFCLDVPMLIYHHVQPLAEANELGHAQLTVDSGIFDEQMNYLVTNGYHIISSDEVVNALLSHQQLPAKSIVVTLDDGYDDAYNYAFPIAKKYHISLDWMIPSGLIENPGYMTWAQLKDATQSNLIHIYNHSWSHADLGSVDEAKLEQEVVVPNKQLEATLGKPINIFTYPYGSFSDTTIAFLQAHGFIAGISTLDGTEQCTSYIMTLHRTHIGNAPLSSYGF